MCCVEGVDTYAHQSVVKVTSTFRLSDLVLQCSTHVEEVQQVARSFSARTRSSNLRLGQVGSSVTRKINLDEVVNVAHHHLSDRSETLTVSIFCTLFYSILFSLCLSVVLFAF